MEILYRGFANRKGSRWWRASRCGDMTNLKEKSIESAAELGNIMELWIEKKYNNMSSLCEMALFERYYCAFGMVMRNFNQFWYRHVGSCHWNAADVGWYTQKFSNSSSILATNFLQAEFIEAIADRGVNRCFEHEIERLEFARYPEENFTPLINFNQSSFIITEPFTMWNV